MKDFFLRRCISSLFLLSAAYSVDTTAQATAQATAQDNALKLSGFGTVGLAYNSSREFDYLRDLLQTKGVGASHRFDVGIDSLLGLQLSATASDNLDFTAQIVTRRSYQGFRPEVSWLFAKYSPTDELDLRAGRLGFDVYPLADSRNVAYSYLWVRPPVEYFGGLILSHIDGADLVYKFNGESSQTKFKLFAGKATEEILTNIPDDFFSLKGSKLIGAHLEFQSQHWLARVGLAQLKFNNEFGGLVPFLETLRSPQLTAINPALPALAQDISFREKKIHYLSAGLVYDQGPLQAQLMYSRLKSQTSGFSSNEAAFFTVGYRMKEWTPYFTVAKTRPILIKSLSAGLPAGVNPQFDAINSGIQDISINTQSAQNSQSVGLRYNLSNSSDLKIQVDHIQNTRGLLVRSSKDSWDGKSNIISFTFNFIFN
nr:hypothetical protein [uncultured Undibacterium sp.]